MPGDISGHRAVIVLDFANACIRVNGFRGEKRDSGVTIRAGQGDNLSYEWRDGDGRRMLVEHGTSHPSSIAARVRAIRQRIPAAPMAVGLEEPHLSAGQSGPRTKTVVREPGGFGWFLLPREIRRMAESRISERKRHQQNLFRK
ncbi:MAG TPA: hypothetical protein VIS96_05910 [Terrimicrobiaceae bacterium]